MFCEVFGGAPPLPNPPPEGRPEWSGHCWPPVPASFFWTCAALGRPTNRETKPRMDSAMARDVVALIEHLRLVAVDVVGFSVGAGTAARLLILRPPQVKSAILAAIGDYAIEDTILELPQNWPVPDSVPRPLTLRVWAEEGADSGEGRNRARAPWLPSSYCSSCNGSRPESVGNRHSGCGRTVAPALPAEQLRWIEGSKCQCLCSTGRQMQPTRRRVGSLKRFHRQVQLNAKGTITPLRMNRHFTER
jgi:pimeloyl-ACP methyl ester carboxylesterase